MFIKKLVIFCCLILWTSIVCADNGYRLWLRYEKITANKIAAQYKKQLQQIIMGGSSATAQKTIEELTLALNGLLGNTPPIVKTLSSNGTLIIGTKANNKIIASLDLPDLKKLNEEGYLIASKTIQQKTCIIITGQTEIGVMYGVFNFLRILQTNQSIELLNILSSPTIKLRMLNHWDNLNRTVERGYAGFSIWNWHTLPGYIDQRYIDYARANASIGINATVLNNVNSNATILTPQYIEKVAALANIFRPYGIKVFLSARFSAPIEIGGLKTANPLDVSVQEWWKQKTKEIFASIPDFGGFLVKANSEGQPGPQDYGRSHADGANMLADALTPYHGVVLWRAFVYSQQSNDRFKQAYEEFKPLDGQFKNNVIVQVKNGPIDFQPREPFSPLFGAMPKTILGMEFQLTQEYLGQGTHLVYEAPLFKEVLNTETYAKASTTDQSGMGKGSTVSKIIDGSFYNSSQSAIAGVSNIGNDINWCGHPFAQANWYALGRLAWDTHLSSEQIAEEWIRQTFSNDSTFVHEIKNNMMQSHEAMVNYMTPLGLAHIMYNGHHYGPMPWGNTLGRPDWNPVYYHRVDSVGLGFNRTVTGTNALALYSTAINNQFNNINTCPDKYVLWFHHVAWNHTMQSGKSLWNELCFKYNQGVDSIKSIQANWNKQKRLVDTERFNQVKQLLAIQVNEAIWWRNACLLYFQTFSKMPIPAVYEQPDKTLEYYKSLTFPFAPGN